MAGLLGLSNSHLILSVFLESYMFSAVALIVFLLLIQQEEKPLAHLVPAGLLSFGITMTNFIQTCILFFVTTPRIKTIFKYVLSVLILAVFSRFYSRQPLSIQRSILSSVVVFAGAGLSIQPLRGATPKRGRPRQRAGAFDADVQRSGAPAAYLAGGNGL
jgi:uncharacterized protein (DUF486 family)